MMILDRPRVACWCGFLATAVTLWAPPSLAADSLELRPLAGTPQLWLANGSATMWRNVGIAAESGPLDVEAEVASCVQVAAPTVAFSFGNSCAGQSGPWADATPGRQWKATFKIPRWHADAPLVDLALRQWRFPMRTGDAAEGASGTAAELTVTHPFGSLEAFYGYSLPLASPAQDRWRSAFAGLSWRVAKGATVELAAERGSDAAAGAIDRTVTLRVWYAAFGGRINAWATRAFDDPAAGLRGGVGIAYTF